MSSAILQVSGGIFSEIITWVRRIIKSPSPLAISEAVISDYINRFVTYDIPERILLMELKRQYTFETQAGIAEYQAPFAPATPWNFPFNNAPPPFNQNTTGVNSQTPVMLYHEFRPPIFCDGVPMRWTQSTSEFMGVYPELVLNEIPLQGDGTGNPYTVNLGRTPVLRAVIDDLGNLKPYVYITFVDAKGGQHYIVDSSFLNSSGEGILIETDSTFQNIIGAPLIGTPPTGGGAGTIDYNTGVINFTWNSATVPSGTNIELQTCPFSPGMPRICLFFNQIFKLFPVPSRAYKIQVDAYITPSVFFQTNSAVPFAYMSEYIARGAARKILSDNGDYEQMAFYDPLFREQENLVVRKTTRQNAVTRTPTIFSAQTGGNGAHGNLFTQY